MPYLRETVRVYYNKFYAGDGMVGLVSRKFLEQGLRQLEYFPESPSKPTQYSEYTYFSDMGRALARITSIFFNQRQIGPPPRATKQAIRKPATRDDNDSSSDDEQPTQRSRRQRPTKKSPRNDPESPR